MRCLSDTLYGNEIFTNTGMYTTNWDILGIVVTMVFDLRNADFLLWNAIGWIKCDLTGQSSKSWKTVLLRVISAVEAFCKGLQRKRI